MVVNFSKREKENRKILGLESDTTTEEKAKKKETKKESNKKK